LTLMGDRRAHIAFTDPPFNVRIAGHVSGNGQAQHPKFAMASGEMSESEFTAFLSTCLGNLSRWSTDGSIHFIEMDWRHMTGLLSAGKQVYDSLLNLCVWNKNNGGMGGFYRSQHELNLRLQNVARDHTEITSSSESLAGTEPTPRTILAPILSPGPVRKETCSRCAPL
jgi:hypothetical protein